LLQLFLACLRNLQAANILNDVDNARLFSNIPDIYAANKHFWCQHLLPMLAESRKTGKPLNPQLLLDGFRRVRTFNKHLYSRHSSYMILLKLVSFFLHRWKTLTCPLPRNLDETIDFDEKGTQSCNAFLEFKPTTQFVVDLRLCLTCLKSLSCWVQRIFLITIMNIKYQCYKLHVGVSVISREV
jgi:hypothetical protein